MGAEGSDACELPGWHAWAARGPAGPRTPCSRLQVADLDQSGSSLMCKSSMEPGKSLEGGTAFRRAQHWPSGRLRQPDVPASTL